MTCAVRYQSRSGNTARVARAIAEAVGVPAQPVGDALSEPVDLLFLGGAVYGGGVDAALRAYIDALDPGTIKRVAVFSTAAIKASSYEGIRRLVAARGIPVDERAFHCRGRFTALHRKRPNEEDLRAAAEFARTVAATAAPE